MSTLYITLKRKPKQNQFFHRKPLLKANESRRQGGSASGSTYGPWNQNPHVFVFLFFCFFLKSFCVFFKTTNKQSPRPENRHILSKQTGRPDAKNGMLLSKQLISSHGSRNTWIGPSPRPWPVLASSRNYTCSIHKACFSFSSK